MKNLTFKNIFTIVMVLTLTTGFLTGCDNKKGNGPNSGIYDPYHPNGGQFPSRYNYIGNLQVVSKDVYREFLQGNVCSNNRECKRINGNPFVQVAFQDVNFTSSNTSGKTIYSQVRYQFQDRNKFQSGLAFRSYILALQQVGYGRLKGSAYNANQQNGIGARVEYSLHGDPSYGFKLQVRYDGYLMLEGRLTLSR